MKEEFILDGSFLAMAIIISSCIDLYYATPTFSLRKGLDRQGEVVLFKEQGRLYEFWAKFRSEGFYASWRMLEIDDRSDQGGDPFANEWEGL